LRYEYRLTKKGLDLYPVIPGLKAWGEKHAQELFGTRDVRATFSNQFVAERTRRRAAFLRKRTPTTRTTNVRRLQPKSARS